MTDAVPVEASSEHKRRSYILTDSDALTKLGNQLPRQLVETPFELDHLVVEHGVPSCHRPIDYLVADPGSMMSGTWKAAVVLMSAFSVRPRSCSLISSGAVMISGFMH